MKNSRSGAALAVALLTLLALPAQASPDLCEAAAERAAAETGVPADVLRAITLAETGRTHAGRLRPWPWAANLEGQGHWFDTAEAALAFARRALEQGRDSLDLGCFQINWRWHGAAFDGPQDLLDPLAAARYAARFLRRLHDELGDWNRAAGAYHSRTPDLAARYRARFARLRTTLDPQVAARAPAAPPPAPPRVNAFPLLIAPAGDAPASLASLFPAETPRGPDLLAEGARP